MMMMTMMMMIIIIIIIITAVIFGEIVGNFFFACFHIFNDLFFIQHNFLVSIFKIGIEKKTVISLVGALGLI